MSVMGFSAWWTIGPRGYLKSCSFFIASLHSKIERHCIFLLQFTSRMDWKWSWSLESHFFINILIAKGTKKRDAPSAAWRGGGGRMSSCITKSGIRTRTKHSKPTKVSSETKWVSCSCGQLCKNFRGLKLHQIKAKCQASEKKIHTWKMFCVIDWYP